MASAIKVVGTVATDLKEIQLSTGTQLCSFRLASSERRYDRKTESWVNSDTNWFTVNVFNSLAKNALQSFNKGDRLIVSGRLRVKQWEREEKSGTSVEIDADALGHDVRWGVSSFQKSIQTSVAGDVSAIAHAGGWHSAEYQQGNASQTGNNPTGGEDDRELQEESAASIRDTQDTTVPF